MFSKLRIIKCLTVLYKGSLIEAICDNVERRGNGNTLKVSVKIKNIPFIL